MLQEEVCKRTTLIETRSLLSDETAEAGDASCHIFEIKFRVAQVAAISIRLGLVALVCMIVIRKVRRNKGDTP